LTAASASCTADTASSTLISCWTTPMMAAAAPAAPRDAEMVGYIETTPAEGKA